MFPKRGLILHSVGLGNPGTLLLYTSPVIGVLTANHADNFFLGLPFFKKHEQVKISDKKEPRFGDIVTPFSSSNEKDKLSETSLKINILRNYICNVTQIIFLELNPIGHLLVYALQNLCLYTFFVF